MPGPAQQSWVVVVDGINFGAIVGGRARYESARCVRGIFHFIRRQSSFSATTPSWNVAIIGRAVGHLAFHHLSWKISLHGVTTCVVKHA